MSESVRVYVRVVAVVVVERLKQEARGVGDKVGLCLCGTDPLSVQPLRCALQP